MTTDDGADGRDGEIPDDDEIRTADAGSEPKPEPTNDETDRSRDDETDEETPLGIDRERALSYLRWGTLLVLAVVVLVSGAGLYSSLGAIIDVWVADRYQPIARAGVNLAILCAAVGGVLAVLRRL